MRCTIALIDYNVNLFYLKVNQVLTDNDVSLLDAGFVECPRLLLRLRAVARLRLAQDGADDVLIPLVNCLDGQNHFSKLNR